MTVKVTLSEPIMAHGKQINEIELCVPKGKHIRNCGMPFKVVEENNNTTRFDFDTEACAKYITALGGIPPSSVNEIGAADFLKLQNEIVGFFGVGDPKTPSIDIGN